MDIISILESKDFNLHPTHNGFLLKHKVEKYGHWPHRETTTYSPCTWNKLILLNFAEKIIKQSAG